MFEYNNYYDFIMLDAEDVEKKKDRVQKRNLFAINFNRLAGYHDSWNLTKIRIYEYMLLSDKLYRHLDSNKHKGKKFTRKTTMIADATEVSKNTVTTYLRKFEADGYLTIERVKKKGTSQLNWYTVNYDKIKKSLDKIYDFGDQNKEDIREHKKFLRECYDYHSKSPYQKSGKQESAKSEGEDTGIDPFGGKEFDNDEDAFNLE